MSYLQYRLTLVREVYVRAQHSPLHWLQDPVCVESRGFTLVRPNGGLVFLNSSLQHEKQLSWDHTVPLKSNYLIARLFISHSSHLKQHIDKKNFHLAERMRYHPTKLIMVSLAVASKFCKLVRKCFDYLDLWMPWCSWNLELASKIVLLTPPTFSMLDIFLIIMTQLFPTVESFLASFLKPNSDLPITQLYISQNDLIRYFWRSPWPTIR